MACKHGYPDVCPLCTAIINVDADEFVLLRDEEWYPRDLLHVHLDDDVFWPDVDTTDENMDWTDLPFLLDVEMEPQGNSNSADKNSSQATGNEGVIINNYYSNQYQNSVDLSAASAGYGSGEKAEGQLGNILGNVTSAFASALPMLADQNTEEMENLSDRVSADKAGNTVTNTQSTVGRLFGYGKTHKGEHPASCADTATDKVLAAERYYTFSIANWTQTQQAFDFVRIPLPHVLSGEDGGVFGATLRRHYLLKTGWRIQVQCNASQFHAGSLLVFLAPEFYTGPFTAEEPTAAQVFAPDSTWQSNPNFWKGQTFMTEVHAAMAMNHQNPWQWTMYPHQYINLRTNTTADLEVPYVNIAPTSSWTQHANWTLVIAVMTPLQYVSGAATDVGITCSIQPVKPVFNGLRHETVRPQGPFPITVREHVGTFFSTNPDTTMPVYGRTVNTPFDYMSGEFKDLLELTKVPTFLGNPTSSGGRQPYFSATNTVQETPLATYQVALSCACMCNSMLVAVARNFNQYRGSLNFTFIFTGTAMVKGKFLIAYTPPGAGQPITRDQAMQATYAIWDLGLNSSYNFTVPFISPTHYRQISYTTSTITTVDGWLTIWQLTPLTYPANTPPNSDILTLISAGSDFTLRMPISPTKWTLQGVDNAEKGTVADDDATVDFVAEPVKLPENQTMVDFFYDRSVPVCALYARNDNVSNFTFGRNSNTLNSALLTPLPSYPDSDTTLNDPVVTGPPQQWRWLSSTKTNTTSGFPLPYRTAQDYSFISFSPFTYYKSDLEVTIVGTGVNAQALTIKWIPSGAPLNTGQQIYSYVAGSLEGRTPGFSVQGQGTANSISFVVPFTSPLSVLPAVWYNGFPTFDNNGGFGKAPNNDFGLIMCQGSTGNYRVYFRYKKMRVFCPRPTMFFPWPSTNATKVRETVDTVLELESPLRIYRVDLFICFGERISFVYKCHGKTIMSFKIPGFSYTPAGRLLVCLGESPTCCGAVRANYMYHLVFTADHGTRHWTVYKGRQRPWKKPLHEEVGEGFETFNEFFKFIRSIHSSYYHMRLIHDVEMNPGPDINQVFQPQGAALTKAQEPAQDMVKHLIYKALGLSNKCKDIPRVVSMMCDVMETWEKTKLTLSNPTFWTKVVLRCIKMVCASILYAHNPDATTLMCLTAMMGMDLLLEDSIFSFLKYKLGKIFKTAPPPVPTLCMEQQDPLREVNSGFQLAKNIEWAVKILKQIFDWVTSWFEKEKQTPQTLLDEMLLDFPEHSRKIADLKTGKRAYCECKKSFEYFEKLYEVAVRVNRIPLANLCEKYKNKHDHAAARPEPIVVVLRGDAGQGKSISSQLIAQAVSKLALGKQSVYAHPPDSDYFDGYQNQYSVIMDDLGQNPDGEDFTTFCQMVSTTNFLPNMAHLDQKGTPFTSQFIIATTNLPKFRPVTVAHYPAVERRITFDYTVRAGPACQTAAGLLNLEAAMQETGEQPQLNCFTTDCPLLHKRGLVFQCNRTQNLYNLQQVVDRVIKQIRDRETNVRKMNTLVAQSGVTEDQIKALENCICVLRQKNAATEEQLEELQTCFDEMVERQNFLADWMKISAIVFASLASLSAVVKLISKTKELISPTPKPVVLTEAEQAAYGNVARGVKSALQVLDLQGGGKVVAQSGNPVHDFEAFCVKNLVSPITFTFQDGGELTQSCLLLKGHLLAVNRHVAEQNWIAIRVRDVRHDRPTLVIRSVNRSGLEVDLTFIKVSKGPLFRDNTKKFCSKDDQFPNRNDDVIGIMNNGVGMIFSGKFIIGNHPVSVTTGNVFNHCLHYRAQTYKGWCGSAVICEVNGKKSVYGMHSAGGGGLAAATIITKEMIEAAEMQMTLTPQGAIVNLEPGEHIHVPRKTKLRKTIAFDVFKPAYEPAILSKYDPRTQLNVDDVAFSKHTQNVEQLPEVFKMVAREYANRVFSLLGRDNGLITSQEAILGLPGMDPMEKTTSPGLPYTQRQLRRQDLCDFETGDMYLSLGLAHDKLTQGDYSDIIYQSFL
ncbi:polyprotein, partial [Genet fecal theilovirus]